MTGESKKQFTQLGTRWPNLVLIHDNEKGYEFRVQLEVQLHDKDEGKEIADLLHDGAADSLSAAKELVMNLIDAGAREEFKQIVADSFDLNIDRVKKKDQK